MNETKRKGLLGKILVLSVALVMIVTLVCIALPSESYAATTIERSEMLDDMMNMATSYVVVYHKQLGGSHYAYSEGLAEESNDGSTSVEGNESVFNPGSKMTLITLSYQDGNVVKEEATLVRCSSGVIRDPDVSPDGTKIVFSMKEKSTDDYHLYIFDLTTGKKTQITFGSGVADIEPVFCADGSIIFNSTRDIQTVDCWITPVSNLYKCDADGSNITRLGYDQVHTTYPTTTEDGRILYTRWDYNDRTQMYVQAIFQMFADGTNQTEVYGNDLSNPTSLIHTREIPGADGKYITITCGHHQVQCGKLAILNTNLGRDVSSAIDYVWDDSYTKQLESSYDNDTAYYQQGRVYKYPYAINEDTFLVSTAETYSGVSTAFNIELINTNGDSVVIAEGNTSFPASQIVPIKTTALFNRASLVDYSMNYGYFYVGNVYDGQDIAVGTVKYLRVVGLEFRSSAIGATNGRGTGSSDPYSPVSTGNGSWDVKEVLGIVPVYEDGSALFTCPAGIPVYFQLLDENGYVVQTMRSWSTLQPGEYFSCIGCHVDKNQAPSTNAKVTLAMNNGVCELQPDLWMSSFEEYEGFDPYVDDPIGFDYLTVVQPILDQSCVSCHSDSVTAYKDIAATALGEGFDATLADYLFTTRDSWYYTTTTPAADWKTADVSADWTLDYGPFGKIGTAPGSINTVWTSNEIYLRKTVSVTNAELNSYLLNLYLAYTGTVEISVNGTVIYTGSGEQTQFTNVTLSGDAVKAFKLGNNEIAVKVTATSSGGQFFDMALIRSLGGSSGSSGGTVTLFSKGSEWTYTTSSADSYGFGTAGDWTSADFDTTGWLTGKTPFGNRVVGQTTDWATKGNNYLWARKTFTVDDLSDLGASFGLYMNVFYDDDFYVFLNGHLIFSNPGKWNDAYEDIKTTGAAYVKQGENVIAICLHQHDGGYEFDMSLYTVPTASNVEISLQSTDVYARRMKKAFPLSYLVLTASKGESSGQFVATSVNKYTNWVSSMSQCEMLSPYSYGAYKSNLIKMLREGHGDLTEEEIRAIACWIDLGVPCYGTYDVKEYWGTNEIREFEEEENKREFYEKLNEYAILARAGQTPAGEITISYTHSSSVDSVTGEGMVTLYYDSKYAAGDTISVKLPDGQKYLGLSLSSRVGESIIYCPNSTFEMTLPDLRTCYPNTMDPNLAVDYIVNTITARIVPESELTEVHNLAQNSYDLTNASGSYPHVTASSVKENKAYFEARNLIDGFTANRDKGEYPSQSWEAQKFDESTTLTIDFGRTVKVDELVFYIRRASGDSYFTNCTVTLSDGTVLPLSLTDSRDAQTIDLGGVETTSLTFSGFVVETSINNGSYAGISEIQVMGTEVLG
ncbi:MAG: hypothetical protein ACI3YK_07715 [Eubacteriales bacterium]